MAGQVSEHMPERNSEHMPEQTSGRNVSKHIVDLMPDQMNIVSVHMSGSVCQDGVSIHLPRLLPNRRGSFEVRCVIVFR